MAVARKISFLMRSAQGGGAERVMIALANQLAARGEQIEFIFISANGPFLADLHPQIECIDLAAKRSLHAPFKLYQHLSKARPQLLISALNYINVLALLVCRGLGAKAPKLIITEHGTLSAVQHSLSGTGRWVPQLMRYCYRWADQIVAVSDGVAEDLALQLRLPRARIQTIYNPMDIDGILQKNQQVLAHPWAQQPTPIILAAGRLVAVKNFALLIAAFNRVRRQQHCRLVILGEGPQRATLEALRSQSAYAEDIALLGFSTEPYAWMAAAELFVLSSNSEGLPTVLIEALVSGAQVISTDCPSGPREILADGALGRLVPVADEAALAAAMLAHFAAPEHRPVDLAALRARFGQDSIATQYQQLIIELCKGQVA
jgi:glycosyltransferase involved in cell wall biosynthesis